MPGEEEKAESGAFNIEKQSQPVAIKRTDNEFVAYANHAGIGVTPEEAALKFAIRDPERSEAESVATIYISLPLMKRLANVFASSVEQYEKVFGTITEDPGDRMLPEARDKSGL